MIDDESKVFLQLQESLKAHDLFHAPTLAGVKDIFKRNEIDLAIVDLNLKVAGNDRFSGLDYIKKLNERYPHMSILVISKYDDPERIKQAIQNGATDYLWKGGFKANSVEFRTKINELVRRKKSLEQLSIEFRREIIGESPQTQQLRRELENYAREQKSLFLLGERGVGKENFVRFLHYVAADKYRHYSLARPPITVNVSDFSPGDLEQAFRAKEKTSPFSFLLQAHQNILYVKNLASVSQELQEKFLDVCQTRKLPNGRPANIQFVFGIEADAEVNQIIPELFHALTTVRIQPLRDRAADLHQLIPAWLKEKGADPDRLMPETIFSLWTGYAYPRNNSELFGLLQNALTRHQIRYPEGAWKTKPLGIQDLPEVIQKSGEREEDMFLQVARLELGFIERALQRFDMERDQKTRAAHSLGITSADNMTKTYIKKYHQKYPSLLSQYPMIMKCYGEQLDN